MDSGVQSAILASSVATTDAPAAAPIAPVPQRDGFVWVDAPTGGFWRRRKAGEVDPPPLPTPADTTFKVAAVKCRFLVPNP
jgi:hypothetical protein